MNIRKHINSIESAAIGLSVLGTAVAILTQQIAYITTPLTLSLSLSLVNRQKELATSQRRLANLEQQLIVLPAAPTTVEFYKLVASVNTDRQKLKQLETLLSEIQNKDNSLFLTEIDLTKDSLKQLSLNFSNFEKEFNYRQDPTNLTSTEREFGEIVSNIQTLTAIDISDNSDLLEHSLNFLELDLAKDSIYAPIEQMKVKVQLLEESSKVSEDAIKQIGWRFLELEQAFTERQERSDIVRIDSTVTEITNKIQTIESDFSNTKTDYFLKLTGLELDRDNIQASLADTKFTIGQLVANTTSVDTSQQIENLDISLGDLHDYSLRLKNRIDAIETVATNPQIQQLIQQQIESQFAVVKQSLPNNYRYDLICGRSQSRQLFLDALQQSRSRLILVCPWLTKYAINSDVIELMRAALKRGVSLEIGWGHLKDVDNNRAYLSQAELLKSNDWHYNALPGLSELQIEYDRLLKLKVLGTHEKFLVCDRQFAMLGSHNYLTSDTKSSEREVGLKTDNPEIIDKLIELFDRAEA
ncbi:phospholipase D-like domain-containing protein [Chamaesiphon sp. GL140_3_metabinner_50]|uniref:phospholipase D-like domain-containing protein n=1 Tax=Chamaesiphon sp. GL140_3_metabinner_50 TaxID=2970812 RepID=UPI0025EDCEF0|nr:phospholipase D-like domain-containing protein [Chamaesiphon sp. GL140_3_metabinner_50]